MNAMALRKARLDNPYYGTTIILLESNYVLLFEKGNHFPVFCSCSPLL